MLANNNHFRFLTPTPIQPDLPLFVFLPGMDGTGNLLRLQIEYGLADAFDIRCLVIPPNDISTWEELTEKVVALLRAELRGTTRCVYLCGESFGGCLAMKVILRVPELFDRLILVNPASCFNRLTWIEWGSHLTGWLPPPMYPLSVMGLLPFLASLGRILQRERQDLLAAMQSVPQHTSTWRVSLLRMFEIDRSELSRITQPVLAIASRADRLLASEAESTRLLHCLPNAKRVLLPDSGHACLLEHEINLYAILKERDFLPAHNPIFTAV